MRAKKILAPLALLFVGYLIYSRWDSIAAFGKDPISFLVFSFVLLLLALGIYRILRY